MHKNPGENSTKSTSAPKIHNIAWDDEQVSRLWDYYACTHPYSDLYFAKLFGGLILSEASLPANYPLEILDFGCGPGFMWDHVRRKYPSWFYTGLDFSSASVNATLAKGINATHFRGAVRTKHLPSELPDESFDVALLVEVVEHLKDIELDKTLAEVHRLLKTNGILIITTPNDENLSLSNKLCPECGAVFHEWQHVRSWSAKILRHRLEAHGFTEIRRKTLDFREKGWGILPIIRRFISVMRLLTGKKANPPHLLSVFQK